MTGRKGSSPRMRGARLLQVVDHLGGGIIPAYAGSTVSAGPISSRCRDHPRVCGEHCWCLIHFRAGSGSSPRMRGAREGYIN